MTTATFVLFCCAAACAALAVRAHKRARRAALIAEAARLVAERHMLTARRCAAAAQAGRPRLLPYESDADDEPVILPFPGVDPDARTRD